MENTAGYRQNTQKFERLPREVKKRLGRRRPELEDILFCLLNTRSRKHEWIIEYLWADLLRLNPGKSDLTLLLEHCPSLNEKVWKIFLELDPSASELYYASIYAWKDKIRGMARMEYHLRQPAEEDADKDAEIPYQEPSALCAASL